MSTEFNELENLRHQQITTALAKIEQNLKDIRKDTQGICVSMSMILSTLEKIEHKTKR